MVRRVRRFVKRGRFRKRGTLGKLVEQSTEQLSLEDCRKLLGDNARDRPEGDERVARRHASNRYLPRRRPPLRRR